MNEKTLTLLTIFAITLTIIITLALTLFQVQTPTEITPIAMEYETEIFNDEIFSVDILADEQTWQHILETATDEQYTAVDVVVNGTLFQNVGIRPKGNSSLQFIAMDPTSSRFSFKIKFDEYIDGQTCFGLDVLVLNNLYSDDSYLREYISFEMMDELGIVAPLYSYADVTLNGNPWGLYLGIESYNNSFQKRVYGNSNGYLYSAKTTGIVDNNSLSSSHDTFSSNGLDLKYVGRDITRYSGLFDNSIGATADRADNLRVVKAIEVLNNYKNLDELEEYWDMEQIIPYLAAHTASVNSDSYSTFMSQNYVLYEHNGKVSVLPWDYSSTFGILFMSNDASDIVNFPIDTPVFGIEMAERPLIEAVLSNEIYKQQYYAYLSNLATYLAAANETIATIDASINTYVQNDATAFCTYDEFTAARDELAQLLLLRGESIAGQINGTVPATTSTQAANPEQLVNSQVLTLFANSKQDKPSAVPSMNDGIPDFDTIKQAMIDMGIEVNDAMVNQILDTMNGNKPNPKQIAADIMIMLGFIAITFVATIFIKKL